MIEASIPPDLIVIILIAAFVIYKYRQVLGHKTGHDVENTSHRPAPRHEQDDERVVQLTQYRDGQENEWQEEAAGPSPDLALKTIEDPKQRETIEAMKQVDAQFTLDDFMKGAKGAFEMLIDAFNEADRASLKMLLKEELYAEFDRELKQLEKKQHSSHTTLVSILSADVKEASLEDGKARLTVTFLSEQIQIVKDKDGKITEGEVSKIDQVIDEWVFERNLKSRNPNWMIVDM